VVGEHGGKLGEAGPVPAGGMQQAAVKEQHISCVQFGGNPPVEDLAVLLDIFAEEKRIVELLAPELDPVRTRYQQQTTVFPRVPARPPATPIPGLVSRMTSNGCPDARKSHC